MKGERGMSDRVLKGGRINYVRPRLTDYQLRDIFCKERISVIEASTKVGKTAACIAWLLEKAIELGKPGRLFWWVAPSYRQAEIAYGRLKRNIPEASRIHNDGKLKIVLVNGAIIEFRSGELADNLYGDNVYAMVIDEATRLGEDAWWACRSTLTKTEGMVRIIGNIKGTKNWAYNLARKAEANEPGMHYGKITCYDAVKAGIISKEEVEEARRILPENVFKELYEAIPNQMGSNPFGLDYIKSCIKPLSDRAPRVFGIDLAKSQDWTVIIGLDDNANVCVFDRFQMPWHETKNRILRLVKGKKALVDSTGAGDPILDELQRSSKAFHGYHFSPQSKQKLMEGLASAIQSVRIGFPPGIVVSELESFEFEYRGKSNNYEGVYYSAPQGCHDDCVVALALAVYHFPNAASMWDVNWSQTSDKIQKLFMQGGY